MGNYRLSGRLVTVDGLALTFDPDDVETFEFSTGYDVHGEPGAQTLGAPNLTLSVQFKPGTPGAKWGPDVR